MFWYQKILKRCNSIPLIHGWWTLLWSFGMCYLDIWPSWSTRCCRNPRSFHTFTSKPEWIFCRMIQSNSGLTADKLVHTEEGESTAQAPTVNLVYSTCHVTLGPQESLEIEIISTSALPTELSWTRESSQIQFILPLLIDTVFPLCLVYSFFRGFKLHQRRAMALAKFLQISRGSKKFDMT